ncbi:(2Fe-2S)-binding protein [Lentzea aerocolonigenes]|uniref:(2Fe-2S)-binding protein n=1 Tax=Lentzea aerocolonigenes TaxID=68170 RepID=UPI0004C379CF|nr:(2Fe-2S)-binding protein [Lentzea aerocolonigenes]MCP2250892.1 FhuF 2Fe-2S C-terminal domain-containing protein [Lentzea aerocolonigenes]
MTVPARVSQKNPRALTPLAESIARLDVGTDISFGPPPSDWTICSDLLSEPTKFDLWRKDLAEWLVEQYGESDDRATAGYIMGWYLNVPGYLAGLLFHTARRVPTLKPCDTAFRIAQDGRPHPDGMAILSDEFACLPDDPASNHPAATVVPSEAALAALLRARYAAHAAQFVASFGQVVRFGRRQLWAAATDMLEYGPWAAGRVCGDENAGVTEAALILPEKLEPFVSASTLHLTNEGWKRKRNSCCFHYVLPEAEPCTACPRTCS